MVDPHYKPKERPISFSKLPAKLRLRYAHARHRITLGVTVDSALIHVSFTGGGMEYWEKIGDDWRILISGRPDGSDIDSLLRTVA